MIEKLEKTVEVTGKAAEKQPDNKFDPDKRVNFEQDKVDKKLEDKSFDPDKRIEVPGAEANVNAEGMDKGQLLEKYVNEYLDDVKKLAAYPETLKGTRIDVSKLEKISDNEERHKEYKKLKPKLIAEWEEKTGMKWPVYDRDIKYKGVIKKKENLFDVHHIHPIELGGENTVNNITPMDFRNHTIKGGIHESSTALSSIKDILDKGVK